ncbi:pentapeptide repeat-containing protein [Halorarius litoreus]|uniref:pentapeptide repeat-containing protein n=1 Tax=Halorarius litoreus TaxID=2962676 RepID=UPI0020CCB009|nr:pentapeptide repeat-containing protein [Halorarius litoreus]
MSTSTSATQRGNGELRSRSESASQSPDNCGFALDIDFDSVAPRTDLQNAPCTRRVWENHDRCVWHARVDGKTTETFAGEAETVADETQLPAEGLDGAYLKAASLVGVEWLAGQSLVGANLEDANVMGADLTDTNLLLADMTNATGINADFSRANMEGADLTRADLRLATLDDARLYGTVLTDVNLGGDILLGQKSVYERLHISPGIAEIAPLEAAAWVYRQFQQLYSDNGLPEAVRESYVNEKDARRRLAWERRDIPNVLRFEVSRWVMRYGESPYRVVLTALVVILVAAVLFPLTGGIHEIQNGQGITYRLVNPEDASSWWIAHVLFKSLYFSVVTFATLGYGDIQPIGTWARLLAGVEALLGALLSALFVFVLARRVTW